MAGQDASRENKDVILSDEQIERAERELGRMEQKLYECYCDVGKSILETAETESRKINALVDQIIETRRWLTDAKEAICCNKCGLDNDRNSVYCKYCGYKLADKREDCGA